MVDIIPRYRIVSAQNERWSASLPVQQSLGALLKVGWLVMSEANLSSKCRYLKNKTDHLLLGYPAACRGHITDGVSKGEKR